MQTVFSAVSKASWFSLGVAVASVLLVGSVVVHAATTISTNVDTEGTLTVDGAATLGSTLGVEGDITLQNDETISNSTNGTITLGATNMVLVGTASTSAIVVGDEPQTPTINGLVFGYCSFADTNITASTTGFVHCTGATGLQTGDRVFVQATSSFDAPFVIQAASTTAAGIISMRVLNTGLNGAADGTLGGTSVNFWAVR